MTTSRPRFLADENFNNHLLRALLRGLPNFDIVRAQDAVVAGAEDPALLAWAATEGRILLTHDAKTIPRFAYDRVRAGLPVPGVVVVALTADLGDALDDLLVLIGASRDEEWRDRVQFVPLR
jgi:hypothetical protein